MSIYSLPTILEKLATKKLNFSESIYLIEQVAHLDVKYRVMFQDYATTITDDKLQKLLLTQDLTLGLSCLDLTLPVQEWFIKNFSAHLPVLYARCHHFTTISAKLVSGLLRHTTAKDLGHLWLKLENDDAKLRVLKQFPECLRYVGHPVYLSYLAQKFIQDYDAELLNYVANVQVTPEAPVALPHAHQATPNPFKSKLRRWKEEPELELIPEPSAPIPVAPQHTTLRQPEDLAPTTPTTEFISKLTRIQGQESSTKDNHNLSVSSEDSASIVHLPKAHPPLDADQERKLANFLKFAVRKWLQTTHNLQVSRQDLFELFVLHDQYTIVNNVELVHTFQHLEYDLKVEIFELAFPVNFSSLSALVLPTATTTRTKHNTQSSEEEANLRLVRRLQELNPNTATLTEVRRVFKQVNATIKQVRTLTSLTGVDTPRWVIDYFYKDLNQLYHLYLDLRLHNFKLS